MEYYEFDCSERPEFVYILDISTADWKSKFKILSEYDLIVIEKGEIEFCATRKHILSVHSTL